MSRPSWIRLAAVLLIALALSPGLFWRDGGSTRKGPQPLTITALPVPEPATLGPGLTLAAAWELDSRSEAFGGYSALLALGGGELLALSDRGRLLRFDPAGGPRVPKIGPVGGADDRDKRLFDIESATRDAASGAIWLGYEGRHAIRRSRDGLATFEEVRPAEMSQWPDNRGAEAMVRLADGRFIVLSEALGGGPRPLSEGLLFPDDPVAGAHPETFHFAPPEGFRPTDMAELPDGRVLILLRRLELVPLPRLTSRLVVADPAAIAPGEPWPWRPFGQIGGPLAENYEGLAVEPREGAVRLWLIADDNGAALQRTLLLAIDWAPQPATKKARRSAARPDLSRGSFVRRLQRPS